MFPFLPTIGSIVSQLANAYAARAKAQTDEARIAADVRIKTLEAKRDVMVSESGNGINQIVRLLFALPVAIYYAKLFVYDKVLALGSTDALSPELTNIAFTVIGFYFLTEGATSVARIIRRRR